MERIRAIGRIHLSVTAWSHGNADPNTRTKNVSLTFDCNINFNTGASLYVFAHPTTHTFYIHLKLWPPRYTTQEAIHSINPEL